jgi:chromosome segregation ATPase
MENNTQTTTQQLENAINTLLDAHEVLQEENKQKDQKIESLNQKISSLEDNIENIEDNNGKQDTILGGLLGKVESIIGSSKRPLDEIETKADQPTLTFEDTNSSTEISEINIDDIVVNPQRTEGNGFDEDRMNKLLGGFN